MELLNVIIKIKTDVMVIFHGYLASIPQLQTSFRIPGTAVIQIISLKMACCYVEHKPAQTADCQPPD